MPGNWSRVKTWISKEKLLFSDLNAEFDNVISNQEPLKFDDYSTNVTQMQQQTTPGGLGSESLATTLAGELERIRYVIARIIGKTYWYEDPLTNIQSATDQAAFYIPFDGDELTTTSAYADCISRGVIINHIARQTENFTSSQIDTTNKKFGNSSFSCVTGSGFAYPNFYGSANQGSLHFWFRNMLNASYMAFNPGLGLEIYLDSSTGVLTFRQTLPTAASQTAKNTVSVAGSVSRASDGTFRSCAAVWSTNASQGAATDRLQLYYDGAVEGTALTSQSYTVNNSQDSIWFFGCRPNTPTWIKFSAMSVLPSAESVSPWTGAGTGTPSVSGGVLTMTQTAGQTYTYDKSTNIDLNAMTIEFKIKLPTGNVFTTAAATSCFPILQCRDDSMDRGFVMEMQQSQCIFYGSSATAAAGTQQGWAIAHDFTKWTTVRITSAGATNPTLNVYINGLHRGTFVVDIADATATDSIQFGLPYASTTANTIQWEYVAYIGTAATAPVQANSTSGNLDEIFQSRSLMTSTTVTTLKTTSPKAYLKRDMYNGLTLFNYTAPGIEATSPSITQFVRHAPGNQDANSQLMYFPSDGRAIFNAVARQSVISGAGPAVIGAISVDGDYLNTSYRQLFSNSSRQTYSNFTNQTDGMVITHEFTVSTPGLHFLETVFSQNAALGTRHSSTFLISQKQRLKT